MENLRELISKIEELKASIEKSNAILREIAEILRKMDYNIYEMMKDIDQIRSSK